MSDYFSDCFSTRADTNLVSTAVWSLSTSVTQPRLLLPCLSQGLFSAARGAEPVFLFFRYQASPWRCGAGFKCDMSLLARCPLFFSRQKRDGGPSVAVRGGVQLGGVCTSSMSRAPKKISKAVPLAAPNGLVTLHQCDTTLTAFLTASPPEGTVSGARVSLSPISQPDFPTFLWGITAEDERIQIEP